MESDAWRLKCPVRRIVYRHARKCELHGLNLQASATLNESAIFETGIG
jgi:hypothetical protein